MTLVDKEQRHLEETSTEPIIDSSGNINLLHPKFRPEQVPKATTISITKIGETLLTQERRVRIPRNLPYCIPYFPESDEVLKTSFILGTNDTLEVYSPREKQVFNVCATHLALDLLGGKQFIKLVALKKSPLLM